MLNEKELINVNAGGVRWAAVGAVGAVVTFIIGVIDGYVRPLKCNK